MVEVKQFRYPYPGVGDVFGYLLFDRSQGLAAAVDGGAVDEILDFLMQNSLKLITVTNTHNHGDHIPGNKALMRESGAPLITPTALAEQKKLPLGDETVRILSTPGHSPHSIVFHWKDILLTGDTLFTGTVGNCYTRDYEMYFRSQAKLAALPGTCRVYPGHDLRDYAVGVARKLDPGNPFLDEYLKKGNRDEEFSLLSEELRVNPFIRWNDPALEEARKSTGMPLDTEFQRFRDLMELH